MRITERFNSAITAVQNSEVTAATVKVASVALYVLKASEGTLASYATRIESGLSICYHITKIFKTNDNWTALLHLQAAGMHTIILLSDVFKHQIVILILDIKELGSLTLQLGRDFGKIDMLFTLGRIGVTGFSIYARIVPSPENIVISVTLKIVIELGKSFDAFYNHQWLDGVGFIAAAGVRGYVNQDHYKYVHHKWEVLTEPEFQKVWARVQQGRDTKFLKDHPLEHLREAIENGSEIFVLNDDGDLMNLGANFSNLGGSLVKDMRLTGRVRKLTDRELIELRFKLTRVAREQLDTVAEEYNAYNPDQLNEFLQFAGVAKKLSLKTKPYFLYTNKKGIDSKEEVGSFKAHQFKLKGLGTVHVGADDKINGLYKNVCASIDGDGTAADMHMLLSLAGMGNAMVPSTPDEILRWKMGLLFRTFYPSKAIKFQRKPEFFSTTLEEFQHKIEKAAPEMKAIIEDKLPQMTQKEVRPGWFEWTIPGLSREVANAGGTYLLHEVTGYSEVTAADRVVYMLKMGMLSTATRFESGQFIEGMSSYSDIVTGGSDAVFTRLQTKQDIAYAFEQDQPDYYDGAKFLISLDTLNRGSYQYPNDEFGEKGTSKAYLKHDNVIDFARSQSTQPTFSNEVMLNQTVAPSDIKAIVLPNAAKKAVLIKRLEAEGLITVRGGQKYFQDRLIDDLIFSQAEVKKAMRIATA